MVMAARRPPFTIIRVTGLIMRARVIAAIRSIADESLWATLGITVRFAIATMADIVNIGMAVAGVAVRYTQAQESAEISIVAMGVAIGAVIGAVGAKL